MKVVRFLVRLVMCLFFLGTVTGAFLGVPYCWLAVKVQGLLWGVLVTVLFGRFFCTTMCPLGMLQSFVNTVFHPKAHVRRVCTRLPETKAQRIVRWSVVAIFALGMAFGIGAVTAIVPISIYGKAVTLWWPGVVLFGLVLLQAVVGHGRVWCNWICPFGTIFNLVSRLSIRKDRIGRNCRHCGRCYDHKA